MKTILTGTIVDLTRDLIDVELSVSHPQSGVTIQTLETLHIDNTLTEKDIGKTLKVIVE
jgi:hypothetical protein